MREKFIAFKMEKELTKLSNSSKLSVIVKTANKELLKDIANIPSLIILLLSPWRFIQWLLTKVKVFNFDKNLVKVLDDEQKRRDEAT